MKQRVRHILWNQMLDRYRANAIDEALIENIEEFLFRPEIEYIRQGLQLLQGFGSEQLCRYLRKRHGQMVLQKQKGKKWKDTILFEYCLLEIILEDEEWKPHCDSGLFKGMQFRVMGNIKYSELPEQLKQKSIDVSKEMVLIPAGEFWMGATEDDKEARKNEKPRHKVTLTKDFYVGKYPVTQALWSSVMRGHKGDYKGALRPVECVTWYNCIEFCNRLSMREGKEPVYTIQGEDISYNWGSNGYRLLTDAEWEYSARANESFKYSGSDNLDEVGWYDENTKLRTGKPVGLKKPNSWGLYDMSGNVHEWVWDLFRKYDYRIRTQLSSIIVDPLGIDVSELPGKPRILRGGGWSNSPHGLRVSSRIYSNAYSYSVVVGFRIGYFP